MIPRIPTFEVMPDFIRDLPGQRMRRARQSRDLLIPVLISHGIIAGQSHVAVEHKQHTRGVPL